MTTNANSGNMFSMAGASLFLPFLPLLPQQILLTNLLTDFPEMAIAHDRVDDELAATPRRWDIRFIGRFMMVFDTLSSVFDFAAFGLLLLAKASPEPLRTGWFVEPAISACLVVLVVRTRRPFWQSLPGILLISTTLAAARLTLTLTYMPCAGVVGFAPLPPWLTHSLLVIVAVCVASAEFAKRKFYGWEAQLAESARRQTKPIGTHE